MVVCVMSGVVRGLLSTHYACVDGGTRITTYVLQTAVRASLVVLVYVQPGKCSDRQHAH
jgi:hypothetical protein